jgi:hypothetical protein
MATKEAESSPLRQAPPPTSTSDKKKTDSWVVEIYQKEVDRLKDHNKSIRLMMIGYQKDAYTTHLCIESEERRINLIGQMIMSCGSKLLTDNQAKTLIDQLQSL